MKVGILTFHWATNYGAILQCFALQSYLEKCGHDVAIINYKPLKYDISIKRYLYYPKSFIYNLLDWKTIYKDYIKEQQLIPFRNQYLHLSSRYYSYTEVSKAVSNYDVIISGSDQILNPSFAEGGEGCKTSTYFLSFPTTALKVGYAVSFGCVNYPVENVPEVKDWIQNFEKIGTREETGLKILQQLNFHKFNEVVPDPTILYGSKIFSDLNICSEKKQYAYVYMLRGIDLDDSFLKNCPYPLKYADNNVHKTSVVKWLEDIHSASYVITNSYHGMIMAILSHIPFAVILETGSLSGMNDRFFTLLSRLNLENRVSDSTSESILSILKSRINWDEVDKMLDDFRTNGEKFLNFA